jgi:hypothetical protein
MAGFAVHMRMLALALCVGYVTVAGLAGLVSGKLHRSSTDLSDGVAAVVPILPKALGNHVASDHKKDNESEDEQSRETKQMPGIFK